MRSQKSVPQMTDRSQNEETPKTAKASRPREDFVRFRLRAEAPDYVAFGGARFSGVFARAQEPWDATKGEWRFWLGPSGFFEIIDEMEAK